MLYFIRFSIKSGISAFDAISFISLIIDIFLIIALIFQSGLEVDTTNKTKTIKQNITLHNKIIQFLEEKSIIMNGAITSSIKCGICKLLIDNNELCCKYPFCGAYFHEDHLFEWLQVKIKCLICNHNFIE